MAHRVFEAMAEDALLDLTSNVGFAKVYERVEYFEGNNDGLVLHSAQRLERAVVNYPSCFSCFIDEVDRELEAAENVVVDGKMRDEIVKIRSTISEILKQQDLELHPK